MKLQRKLAERLALQQAAEVDEAVEEVDVAVPTKPDDLSSQDLSTAEKELQWLEHVTCTKMLNTRRKQRAWKQCRAHGAVCSDEEWFAGVRV